MVVEEAHQIPEEPFQLLGFVLQAEGHPLPHLGGCADDPTSHGGSDVLHQNPPVHLAHQRLPITAVRTCLPASVTCPNVSVLPDKEGGPSS